MHSRETPGASSPAWAIEVRGLTRAFGRQWALRGIDLEVSRGQTVAIFGPNGAGKTTLVKLLASVLKPTSGQVLIDGLDLKDSAEAARRRVGLVTHQTLLYGNLTAGENLEFYCRMYDVPGYKQRVREVAEMVGVTARLHDRVGALSRGIQQRISIARSLLHRPPIMLLDEPEAGLDEPATTMLWEVVCGEGERTVVLTTHDLERGLARCDHVLILAAGKIVYQGPRRAVANLADLKQTYQYCTGAGG